MVEAIREQNRKNEQFQEQRMKLDEKLVTIVSDLANAWQQEPTTTQQGEVTKLTERIMMVEEQTVTLLRTQTSIASKLDMMVQHFQLNTQ